MQLIDQGRFVDVNGIPQWLTLPDTAHGRPAMLVIGGPGSSFAALAPFFAPWQRDFAVVQWDQPGAGFTFAKTPAEPESLERLVVDGIRVAEVACTCLAVRSLVLLCFSAGTIVGLQMARRRPELFSAYVGSGQVVDWARQDALSYEILVRRAAALPDPAMGDELASLGPPPYADAAADAVKSKYAGAPTPREAAAFADLMPLVGAALQGVPAAGHLAQGLQWPEPRARSLAVYTALRSEIVTFEARALGLAFALPLFFLQGADDVFTVTSEVEAYAAELEAPHVEMLQVPDAGHCALLLREDSGALLAARVRPRLAPSRRED